MPQRKPLRYRELLKKLKKFGVVELPSKRGKGSEKILLRPIKEGSDKGPTYPIKNHGDGTELGLGTIRACLNRLGIPEQEFWK